MKKTILFLIVSLLFFSILDARTCSCSQNTNAWSVIYHVPDGTSCKGATTGNGGTVTFTSRDRSFSVTFNITTEDASRFCYP
jgi:predicted enzyme related to lactoylglutathione lyase